MITRDDNAYFVKDLYLIEKGVNERFRQHCVNQHQNWLKKENYDLDPRIVVKGDNEHSKDKSSPHEETVIEESSFRLYSYSLIEWSNSIFDLVCLQSSLQT